MKIGTRVSLMTSALILVMVAGLSTLFFYAEKKALVEETESRHLVLVKTLRQAAQEFLEIKDDILLLNYLKLIRKTEGVEYALVARRDGEIVAHTDTARWGERLSAPDDPGYWRALATQGWHRRTVSGPDNKAVVEVAVPLESQPDVAARIGFSKVVMDAQIQAVLDAHRNRMFAIAAAALGVGLLLSFGLARTLIRPIQRLAQATALIGKGKWDLTLPADSRDELGGLARDFNKMAEQLKELDQMKKDFVSSVTHELRSPLHSTRLYLGLFFKGGAGELNEKQKEYLKIIENNTLRLARFIDDLLDLAKLERGKLDVQKQEFQLQDILGEMRQMFMPHAEQKKIRFEVPPGEALPKLSGDPERTRQIIINLLSNAFKFTPEGGSIAILTAPRNGSLEISVKDSGTGIPGDQLESIFNKFEQVKGVRTKLMGQQKGTGLGLAIVKALVEAQGGKIWVKSELTKGSEFIFTVPVLAA